MSDGFGALVALLGEVLGGPPAPPTVITGAIAGLALQRHGVGALLHQAAAGGRHAIAPVLMAELERSYRRSKQRRGRALARLDAITVVFAVHRIAWTALKGPLQAGQLYPDPDRRESADLDILVAPRDFTRATAALETAGYAARFPALPRRALSRRLVLATARELTFISEDDPAIAIDLHSRLFVAAPPLFLPLAEMAFPTPRPGPELALYLLAHGAVSVWVQLRWMTDLVLLLPRLDAGDWRTLRLLAARNGMTETVEASLLALRAQFPFISMPRNWLDEAMRNSRVRSRLALYAGALGGDGARSPLNHAWSAFEANWQLSTRPSARLRLLSRAPLASAVKRLTGLSPTRRPSASRAQPR